MAILKTDTTRAQLGLATTDSPEFTAVNIGHATDTTLARVSAGVVSIESVNILTVAGGTLTGELDLGENAGLTLDAVLSADGKYSGVVEAGTAGAAITFGQLCYLDPTDSRWELADANAVAGADGDARGKLGMCVLAAAGDGSATKMLLWGKIRADAQFPAMTVNNPLYVSETAGAITGTLPTTAAVVTRVVGIANTADELFFSPSVVSTPPSRFTVYTDIGSRTTSSYQAITETTYTEKATVSLDGASWLALGYTECRFVGRLGYASGGAVWGKLTVGANNSEITTTGNEVKAGAWIPLANAIAVYSVYGKVTSAGTSYMYASQYIEIR